MTAILPFLLPSIITLALVACVAVFVFLKSAAPNWVKAVLIPCALICSALVPISLSGLLGSARPVEELPPRLVVLAHSAVVEDGKKTQLEIWHQWEGGTRLISVRYTRTLEHALQRIQDARARGIQMALITRQGRVDGRVSDANESEEYTAELISPNHGLPIKGD